jgi:hypothetical protein
MTTTGGWSADEQALLQAALSRLGQLTTEKSVPQLDRHPEDREVRAATAEIQRRAELIDTALAGRTKPPQAEVGGFWRSSQQEVFDQFDRLLER